MLRQEAKSDKSTDQMSSQKVSNQGFMKASISSPQQFTKIKFMILNIVLDSQSFIHSILQSKINLESALTKGVNTRSETISKNYINIFKLQNCWTEYSPYPLKYFLKIRNYPIEFHHLSRKKKCRKPNWNWQA